MSTQHVLPSNRVPLFVQALGLSLALVGGLAASEKSISLKEAPAAVQKTVTAELKGGKLRGLSVEVDKGKTTYEAELTVEGHDRDIVIDPEGKIVEAERVVQLSALPEMVRASILHEAAKGTVERVEELTKGGVVSYEALIKETGKKNREIVVGADGKVVPVG